MKNDQSLSEPVLVPIDENPIKGIDDKAISVPAKMVLSLVKTEITDQQIMAIRARTPRAFVKVLPGRGGKDLSYIPVNIYIRKLNFVYGHGGWSHRVIKSQIVEDHAIVEGELTIKATGQQIGQFGGHPMAREILSYEKGDRTIEPWAYSKLRGDDRYGWKKTYGNYVDPGDSFKAAKSDSLKKCCSELGLFSDIYAPEDFSDLSAAKPEPEKLKPAIGNMATQEQKDEIDVLAQKAGVTKADIASRCRADYGVSITQITKVQADGIIERLKLKIKKTVA